MAKIDLFVRIMSSIIETHSIKETTRQILQQIYVFPILAWISKFTHLPKLFFAEILSNLSGSLWNWY